MKNTVAKIKTHINDNIPVYTYALGVVLGGVSVATIYQAQSLAFAANGYNLAMSDVRAMLENGVDVQAYFDSIASTRTVTNLK